jgi:hypothetical protein
MYRIIGTDGKTYGPVTLDQVRQWILQGRADNRTPVFVDGARDWTILGLLPELAANFTGTPPVIAALKPTPAQTGRTNGFATAGLVCSLLAWTCCCCFPFNMFGLAFSLIALLQINARPDLYAGRGIAIAGLILSGLNLLWSAGFALLELALSSPNLMWHANRFP